MRRRQARVTEEEEEEMGGGGASGEVMAVDCLFCGDGPVTSAGFLISCGSGGGKGGASSAGSSQCGRAEWHRLLSNQHLVTDWQRKEEKN